MMFQYFSDDEFERIGSDPTKMNIAMMSKLVSLRSALGIPLPLTSAWRSESRNRQVGGAKNSAHLYGRYSRVLEAQYSRYGNKCSHD